MKGDISVPLGLSLGTGYSGVQIVSIVAMQPSSFHFIGTNQLIRTISTIPIHQGVTSKRRPVNMLVMDLKSCLSIPGQNGDCIANSVAAPRHHQTPHKERSIMNMI